MKLFKCQHCAQVLYFENIRCEKCAHALGYLADRNMLSALDPDGESWRPLADNQLLYRFCANAAFGACNWLVPIDQVGSYCTACRHNRTVPDLGVPANLASWQRFEFAKHRLFYTLLRLKLPLANRNDDPRHGLVFDFLSDAALPAGSKVLTGHEDGVITMALVEADDAERERRRVAMGEPYRTLLGHFRHEVGHYFWDVLVRDGGRLEECRALFGDDSQDYAQALQRHYQNGAPPDWQAHLVSSYASSHPWEDFAETWAHYLHIVDTLEMAGSFGLSVHPCIATRNELTSEVDFDPHEAGTIEKLVEAWLPLTFAMNSLNRCMGAYDLYPFILSPPVVRKLGFIHELVHARQAP